MREAAGGHLNRLCVTVHPRPLLHQCCSMIWERNHKPVHRDTGAHTPMSTRQSDGECVPLQNEDTSTKCQASSPLLPEATAAVDVDIKNAQKAQEPVTAPSQPVREEHQELTAEQCYWFYRRAYEQNYMMQMHLWQVMERGFAAIIAEMQSLDRSLLQAEDNMKACSDTMDMYVTRELAFQKVILNTLSETNSSLETAAQLIKSISENQGHCLTDSCNSIQEYKKGHGADIKCQSLSVSNGLGIHIKIPHDGTAMSQHQRKSSAMDSSFTQQYPSSSGPSRSLSCHNTRRKVYVKNRPERSYSESRKRNYNDIPQHPQGQRSSPCKK